MLIAVTKPFYDVTRGSDPGSIEECAWIKILLSNNIDLLLGNRILPRIVTSIFFLYLGIKCKYIPNFDWPSGTALLSY